MKTLLIIFIFFSLLNCSRKSKNPEPFIPRSVYYIYDQERFFRRDAGPAPYFSYSKLMQDIYHEDRPWMYCLVRPRKNTTFFKKNVSYLDSIKYYDSKWLKNNVGKLWALYNDSVKIYMIEKIEGTDSILFNPVMRATVLSE